ncbi:protein GAMETE EXPRESSED 1-like [Argentina anserina]|uniref:protein GAMETE EXPRESSED 1-like n=1 Tax=Argentina anserina TaxID=57926 RepID=UPI0021765AA0|nr:protein GAMETE EXPRESSED 1-like [Potentilla anserina]XP_050383334.1 protein GAMETE EXPRESSED 1-like [Potentilla anserina]
MGRIKSLIFLLIFLTLSRSCMCWWFSSSSSKTTGYKPPKTLQISGDVPVIFSMEAFHDQRAIQRKEVADKRKLESCWFDAYKGLFAACSEISSDKYDMKKRFSWELSNCFQKEIGRQPFPTCSEGSPMKACLAKLDDNAIETYRAFFIETDSICFQLQSHVFRAETEKLVNQLVKSADYAEGKLETIAEQSEKLLEGSKDIHISLSSIDQQTQEMAQTSKKVGEQIGDIVKQSEIMFEQSERIAASQLDQSEIISASQLEQSEKIAASQLELQKGQEKLKENLQEGVEVIHESYHALGKEIHSLQDETIEIEKKVTEVGDTVSTKMNILQSKADVISNVTEISLEKQKALLEGQSEALDGLQSLTKFQVQALEESRGILQQLAKFGREQQEELLQQQEQIKQGHVNLVKNSKSILAAQEAFEQKQETMFLALDKLFKLQNALFLESRSIKTFFLYSISMLVIYLSTSTKQTYKVRPILYIGLCVAFSIELATVRFSTSGVEQQTMIVNVIRLLYVLFSLVLVVYAAFTYRDYEMLNYNMLKNLTEEFLRFQKNAASPYDYDDSPDAENDESDWITSVDTGVDDGIEYLLDSGSTDHMHEEVGDNSNLITSVTRRYNLRSRR